MQDFEIYGRAMQLGWGQENREEQPSSTEESQDTKIGQQQHEKVSWVLQNDPHTISLYNITLVRRSAKYNQYYYEL